MSESIKSTGNISGSNVIQVQNRANVPQPLTLLMNFRDDGTTSFQIMQGSQIVYLDNGLCGYGQIFDPSTGRCRDIFCQELNHKFNGTACIPDKNMTAPEEHKGMSDIDLSLTIIVSPSNHYERGNFSKRLNSQMNETCIDNWNQMFHNTLHSYLGIDYDRITKVKYRLKQENDHLLNRSVSDTKLKSKQSGKNDTVSILPSYDSSHIAISNIISNNESAVMNFYFTITDRNKVSKDTLTGLHVVTLLLLASEFHVVIDLCQNYSFKVKTLSIISDKNKTQEEFCSEPDVMSPTKNGIIRGRVRPDGEVDYVVDVPELETKYESGDYTYLFMVSTFKQQPVVTSQTSQTPAISQTSEPTSVMKLVSVCNRQPRIVGRCPDSLVMRIALCELVQYQNFSIRIKRSGRLYTNREYRYDDFRPDLYIVVCKHDAYNGTTGGKKLGFVEKAPGFVSSIATFLSIVALAITLITFILFSSLRNLPGCNVINLIIALIIAEALFLSQSLLVITRSSVCLSFALGIHFFYLASFFWMNVMAFDLWKTFHKGFSLYVSEISERLPFYALYAWGMPVIIVVIGIILDAKNAYFKPCYGRFFRGCYDVCFHTKNDIPLQGCWIESALMRFILFGCPVAIILLINFVLYILTVRSIRRGFRNVRIRVGHKFQRKKQVTPGEYDVKIYMRMAVLAGFGWTIGFILFVLPDGRQGFKFYLAATFKYLFILLNATPGLFIFVVYVCNRRVFSLYCQLVIKIYQFLRSNFTVFKEFIFNHAQSGLNRAKLHLKMSSKRKQKPKQKAIAVTISTIPAEVKSFESSNEVVSASLLTQQRSQSSPVICSNQTLDSSALAKQ